MAPKKITVNGSKEMVGSQEGYNNLLRRFGTQGLVNFEDYTINDFESLVHGGTYTLGPPIAARQQQQQPAFLIGAVVRGAKQSNGARGNVFKFLERHGGHYSEQQGIQIRYEQDDLHIQAYFLSYDAACQLQTALNEWEIHKELANLGGVALDPLTPAQMARPPDLKRIYLQDYHPQDSEPPCQTLDQL